jgi:Fic-DOC domain mobile mystery protein B
MMADFDYPDGATPLDKNEIQGLIPTHIITRAELDRWEQDNINEVLIWVTGHKHKDILNESFLKLLHKKMFCDVWKWAGKFRQTEKNIGVPFYKIPVELKKLLDDCKYWIENKIFPEDEIAVRFHHRLVWIHLFPNGNGRHARLMADIMMQNLFKKEAFTWGNTNLAKSGDIRKQYIDSLHTADKGDYKPLLEFAHS